EIDFCNGLPKGRRSDAGEPALAKSPHEPLDGFVDDGAFERLRVRPLRETAVLAPLGMEELPLSRAGVDGLEAREAVTLWRLGPGGRRLQVVEAGHGVAPSGNCNLRTASGRSWTRVNASISTTSWNAICAASATGDG